MDELIPPAQGVSLCAALNEGWSGGATAKKPARVALFPTGMHNDTYMKGGAAYWEALKTFLKETSTTVVYKG